MQANNQLKRGGQFNNCNALSHGLTSQKVLEVEKENFEKFQGRFTDDYKPQSAIEQVLIERMARSIKRSGGSAGIERRMLMLARLVAYLESDKTDLMVSLQGMELFTEHVITHYTAEDSQVISNAIQTFLTELKAELA